MERLQDQGIVIATKRHGEQRFIVTILTENHGVCTGLFRTSKKTKAFCEPGTVVTCHWQARLSEHLGTWSLDPIFSPLSVVFTRTAALVTLNTACALVKATLPERDPAKPVYQSFLALLHHFQEEPFTPYGILECYCFFELFLLAAFAVKLDFSRCAATGTLDNLVYVSPKSGRAVSRDAGAPYHDKLLTLPAFLQNKGGNLATLSAPDCEEILAALTLSGYFLDKYGFSTQECTMPQARYDLIAYCQNSLETDHPLIATG